jgi:hypothetical protein
MKKILVLVLVMVASSTFTFAINPSDYGVFYKLNNESTFKSLINYLNADKEQSDYLKSVFNVTAKEFKTASNSNNEKLAESVLNYNLYNTKCILSDNQYKKYLVMLNISINNASNDPEMTDNFISDARK